MVADSVIINGVDVGTGKVTKVNITKQQVFSLMKKYGLPELQKYLSENKVKRNQVADCPLCNSSIKDRNVALYKELINALYKVYCWCGEHKTHEFETKQIKQFLGKNEYARFGDLVRFGGVVYKPKDDDGKSRKAWFGMNMKRAKDFFSGTTAIPLQITLNQITNEIIDEKRVRVNEFPMLVKLLDKDGLYDYETNLIKERPTMEDAKEAMYQIDKKFGGSKK